MSVYFSVALIVISIALVLAVMFQVKGGGMGGIFGQSSTVFRTKRGIEKTLFQLTIILVILFVVVSMLALRIG